MIVKVLRPCHNVLRKSILSLVLKSRCAVLYRKIKGECIINVSLNRKHLKFMIARINLDGDTKTTLTVKL